MTRLLAASLLTSLTVPGLPPQAPVQIQNARVETRQGLTIADAVASLGASSDPVWIGWRVPLIDGERNLCDTYESQYGRFRGIFLEGGMPTPGTTGSAPATSPVSLEAGTNLVVMLRVVDRRVERQRRFADDCQLDAGGRSVYWLSSVTPAESLRFLDGLITQGALTPAVQSSFAAWAIATIAYHRDPGADTILDRIATSDRDSDLRRQAAQKLAAYRGAHGFDVVRRLLASETSPSVRRTLVKALGDTRQPQTAEALLTLARSDADVEVRREAAFWYPQRAGAAGLDNTVALITGDADSTVRARALSGLSLLPPDQAVPRLLSLARTSTDPVIRKQSVVALGRTKDPRAIAFLEELLRR
jgi:hypothetical protein